ncbi:MAG: polysaccharide deacetylase family protein [Syntrophus sp. (in: bacteria)]|nr:polysaccharide deacetylase family protein [Syntrophus sp. (in: bacteria)]
MLKIKVPPSYPEERAYIIDVIFRLFLGLDFQTEIENRSDTLISADHLNAVILPDVLFQCSREKWLTEDSLPKRPLSIWDAGSLGGNCTLTDFRIPVIYGSATQKHPAPVQTAGHRIIELPIDILGSAFFMLSRYEEAVLKERDVFGRFPAEASLACQEGFLRRPIVNEYAEILWSCLSYGKAGSDGKIGDRRSVMRKPRQFRTMVSCDVDHPYARNVKSLRMTLRNMAGDVLKRRSAVAALRTGLNTVCSSCGYYGFDPMDNFDWIMDTNEKAGNRVAFYFFADRSVPRMDGNYSIHEPRIRSLMRRISARGHEIGLHGSFGTYLDEFQCSKEAGILRAVMEAEGIRQAELGNRQHYLRWSTPETASNLEKAGISYDTTLGFADQPGYRCGTCFEYPMYDLIEGRPLRLWQYPLILMECSVLEERYLGMGCTDSAADLMGELKKQARKFGGNFTLLWHGSRLGRKEARSIYRELVV